MKKKKKIPYCVKYFETLRKNKKEIIFFKENVTAEISTNVIILRTPKAIVIANNENKIRVLRRFSSTLNNKCI